MEFGTLIFLALSLVGVLAQTPCSVPCRRPNGFNPNLLNSTIICPVQEEHRTLDISLIKIVLKDLKNLAHQTKIILERRIQESDLLDDPCINLPAVQALSTINNMPSLRAKLHDHMLIYNVFIERLQWIQQCLFKLEGQTNTISSRLNLIRSGVLTLVCISWDGQQKSENNVDINYLDRQSKYMENIFAYSSMRTLGNYANGMVHKITSLQS